MKLREKQKSQPERYQKICVTDRKLTTKGLPAQMERVLATRPDLVILREKDLDAEAYAALAKQILPMCRAAGVPCWFHGRWEMMVALGADGLQMPLGLLRESVATAPEIHPMGVSVHSVQDAQEAERLGADILVFGHVFPTDCKPGLPPRGLNALREVVQSTSLPVYAIGGISDENAAQCIAAGAAGVCMMSGYMRM